MSLSSGDLVADRRFEWARDCEAKGDLRGAADLLEQALELVPGYASAWFTLGEISEKLGERERAVAAYRKAREADTEDRHGALVCLMRLGAADMSDMPQAYVRALFDHYAPAFDLALTAGLDYRAPALLRDAVEQACRTAGGPMRFGTMLDLGCGTGLAGEAFRAHVDWLVGVDLSPGMIAQARKKTIYDRLQAQDLTEFLGAEAASELLNSLGGLARVEQQNGALTIRSDGCPLAAATQRYPEACNAMQSLLSEFTGLQVTKCCEREERLRCCFELAHLSP